VKDEANQPMIGMIRQFDVENQSMIFLDHGYEDIPSPLTSAKEN